MSPWEGNSGSSDRKVRGGEREASDRPHIQRLGGRHDDDHPGLPLTRCRMPKSSLRVIVFFWMAYIESSTAVSLSSKEAG